MTNPITTTVIISAITSALVSIVAFIVGVRLAKDQGDRAVLRAIYQRLFEHFRTLSEAIERGRPKRWPDFPAEANRYMPVFRKMQQTGEAHLLPASVSAKCEKVEAETLGAGSKHSKWVNETYIPALREFVQSNAPDAKSSMTGRSYRELRASALSLMTAGELSALAEEVQGSELGVGLQIATEPGKHEMLYLYRENAIGGDVGRVLNGAWKLARDDEMAEALRADLLTAKSMLDSLMGALSARVRDPHPLFESISSSLRDALAGR